MPGLFDSQGGPEFSLLGMVLGGRGYASNWFQQRDQMQWLKAAQAAQDAAEAEYGASLMNRPDYQAWRDNPNDRAAGLDFWAGTRGAPGDIDRDIAGYVGTGLTAIYDRQQASLQSQLQRENAAYASSLERSNIDYRTDKDLQLYKDKAAFDQQRQQAIIQGLEGVPGEVAANIRFDTMFPGVRPQDKSIGVGPDGGMYLRPATSSTEYTKMMTQLTAGQSMIDKISDMNTRLERGDFSSYTWKAEQAGLMMNAKNLFESGALDAGSLEVLESMIPKIAWGSDSVQQSRAMEAMRATVIMLQRKNADIAASYSVPISDLPKERQDKKYFPTPRGEPPATGSVTRATKTIEALPPPEKPNYGTPYDSSKGVFQ